MLGTKLASDCPVLHHGPFDLLLRMLCLGGCKEAVHHGRAAPRPPVVQIQQRYQAMGTTFILKNEHVGQAPLVFGKCLKLPSF